MKQEDGQRQKQGESVEEADDELSTYQAQPMACAETRPDDLGRMRPYEAHHDSAENICPELGPCEMFKPFFLPKKVQVQRQNWQVF